MTPRVGAWSPPGWWRRSPWMADAGLAVAVGLIQVLGTVFGAHHHASHREVDGLAIPLLLAGPAALAARRRHPLVVLWVVFAATLTYTTIGYPPGPIFLALIVAFFTAVIAGHRLAGWAAIAAGWALFLWLGSAVGTASAPSLVEALALTAWLLVLLAAAEFVRGRHERAAEARHAREEEARRRAGEERLRIARELHDVLAHNISLINVQAGVALHLIDERPEQARTALAAIKQASSETLREMRSVLGVLRQVDEHAPRSPAPSLARLGELVERSGAAGLTVGVEEEGGRRPLPAGVDLAAFRIVQEALTNVARHAGAASATVRVTYGDDELTVQIDDDGRGTARAATAGGGNGIPGMRERATALGGRLEAGPRQGGGFRVRAWLPLEGEA